MRGSKLSVIAALHCLGRAAQVPLSVPRRSFSFITRPSFLFTFGDSYTSEGWDQTTLPPDPHPRTSSGDGPVWSRTLTESYNPPATLVNLAVGGATVDDAIVDHWWPALSLMRQVDAFIKHYFPATNDPAWHSYNTIFAVEFGTNDVHSTYNGYPRMRRLNQTEEQLHQEIMYHYFDAVERLYNAGARAFAFHPVIPFDRGRIGLGQPLPGRLRLKESIVNFNTALSRAATHYCTLKAQETDGDIFCTIIDIFGLANAIMDNPESYGFKEAFDCCPAYAERYNSSRDMEADPSCVGPVGDYVWKDSLHPSWRFDEEWAWQFKRQMRAEVPLI